MICGLPELDGRLLIVLVALPMFDAQRMCCSEQPTSIGDRIMPKRMHYTQDEWLLLGKAPVQVGMAVMGTGATSPLQMVRELIGIGQALRETGQTSGATALIAELNVETQAQLNELAQQPASAIDFAQIRAQIAETCRKVTAIVDSKESPSAANEYKRWLLWIGRRVAAAAPEDTSNPISAARTESNAPPPLELDALTT
jgi:hypothetical protein